MLASEVNVGTHVSWFDKNKQTGVIVCNRCRSGNEIVVVEWDNGFAITTENVNDLVPLENQDRAVI